MQYVKYIRLVIADVLTPPPAHPQVIFETERQQEDVIPFALLFAPVPLVCIPVPEPA